MLEKSDSDDRLQLFVPKDWAIPIIGTEEYDSILKLSKSDVILNDDWYQKTIKPVAISNGKVSIIGDIK